MRTTRTALWAAALLLISSLPAQDLPRGVQYELRATADPLSIHVLTVQPSRAKLSLERALDRGVGRETVSSIARRKGAVAAVNGGFFAMGGRYDGEPTGIMRLRGEWLSDARLPRAAIGWRKGGREVVIGQVTLDLSLSVRGARLPVDGINRSRGPAEQILYSWFFHNSTLTEEDGTEITIAGGRVSSVERGKDSPIPPRGFVYSVGPKTEADLSPLGLKQRVRIQYALQLYGDSRPAEVERWQRMENIVGGAGLLVRGGNPVRDHAQEKLREGFVTDRHPRTAVGIREDGTWVLVVVDGRQPQLSRGMTLAELADLMISLKCQQALNLDGGGSTTLYLKDKVVNSPSDAGIERPVSDAILIL